MEQNRDFINLMNKSISEVFVDALKASMKQPALAGFIASTIFWQKKAAARRARWESEGLHVPPFMIASITRRCNLRCKGCYSRAHGHAASGDMSAGRWIEILQEARELGISIILLAGGEPFSRKDLLEITDQYKDIVFPIFTNGMLINEQTIELLKKQKNVVPVVSIEGYKANTDGRRGKGVYENSCRLFGELRSSGIFFGASITVNKDNIDLVTSKDFIEMQIKSGCRIFFFVEYVPVEEGTEDMVLGEEQREYLKKSLERLHSDYKGVFISFPGDEESFGGCLAAGRGFVHINPEGSLEPCPFAPYSDTSLKDNTLKIALKSDFLRSVRENHGLLTERKGGCALWENRETVQALLGK